MQLEQIKTVPLFSTLDDQSLKVLHDALFVTRLKKGEILFYEGDKSDFVHLLLEGSVRLYKSAQNGKELEVHRLDAFSLIAEAVTLSSHPFLATAEALTDTVVGKIKKEHFLQLLEHRAFSLLLITSLSHKVRVLSNRLEMETLQSAKEKVIHFLDTNPGALFIRKHNDIARSLNISAETFSRILAELRKEGVLSDG